MCLDTMTSCERPALCAALKTNRAFVRAIPTRFVGRRRPKTGFSNACGFTAQSHRTFGAQTPRHCAQRSQKAVSDTSSHVHFGSQVQTAQETEQST